MSTPTDVALIQSDWHPEVVEEVSVHVVQWGDWIELPYVNRGGTHGRMHRRFHKEGCR